MGVVTVSSRLVALPDDSRGGVQEIGRVLHRGTGQPGSQAAEMIAGPWSLLRSATRSARHPGPKHAMTWKTALAANPSTLDHHWIVWCHGADLTRDNGPWRIARRRIFDSASAIACSTPLAHRMLAALSIPAMLVGPPIQPSPRRPSPASWDRRGTEIRLISVGRLVARKGHDDALAVTRELRTRGLNARLDVVGTGPDHPRLAVLAADLGADVTFHRNITNDQRDALLARADVLLFFSRDDGTEYEGLGMVSLEAAAQGVPTVVTASGGSADGVINGRTGIVLAQESTTADRVEAVLRVLEQRGAMSDEAVSFALSFPISHWWERVRAVERGEQVSWKWPS